LQAFPTIKGIVFDLPRCAESANTLFRETGISDRAEFIAGDFFDAVPKGADTILLKSVIHDWDDGRSAIILERDGSSLNRLGIPKSGLF
jgi:O-methyltransferase domain